MRVLMLLLMLYAPLSLAQTVRTWPNGSREVFYSPGASSVGPYINTPTMSAPGLSVQGHVSQSSGWQTYYIPAYPVIRAAPVQQSYRPAHSAPVPATPAPATYSVKVCVQIEDGRKTFRNCQ